MKETKDFSIFKRKKGNRLLNRKHINKLKELITKHGYLEGYPIIVNSNMEVIDGQHRLQACVELNHPIPYVIDEDLTDNALIDLNISQLKWSMKDYIKYYAEEKQNPNFIRLLTLIKETSLDVVTLLQMAFKCPIGGTFLNHKLKQGQLILEAKELHQIQVTYANILHLRDILRIKITGRLARAINLLEQDPKFSWTTMLEKASKYTSKAYTCTTTEDYIKMLSNLYNYNSRQKTKILQ